MTARNTVCALVAAISAGAFARTVIVPSLPVSPYADTEVSTNIPINKADIGYSDLNFRLNGTPTNDLELAFGTDANTNGVLDAEEVETRFGWSGGRYFVENARTWEMFDGGASGQSQNFSVNLHLEVRHGSQQVRKVIGCRFCSLRRIPMTSAVTGAISPPATSTWYSERG